MALVRSCYLCQNKFKDSSRLVRFLWNPKGTVLILPTMVTRFTDPMVSLLPYYIKDDERRLKCVDGGFSPHQILHANHCCYVQGVPPRSKFSLLKISQTKQSLAALHDSCRQHKAYSVFLLTTLVQCGCCLLEYLKVGRVSWSRTPDRIFEHACSHTGSTQASANLDGKSVLLPDQISNLRNSCTSVSIHSTSWMMPFPTEKLEMHEDLELRKQKPGERPPSGQDMLQAATPRRLPWTLDDPGNRYDYYIFAAQALFATTISVIEGLISLYLTCHML